MTDVKLNFLHVCDYVSFSEGKLNILGVFKSINTNSVPVIHPQMFLVANVGINKSGKYKQSIKIVNEASKSEIFRQDFDLNIEIPKGKKQAEVGTVAQLNNINFANYGKYVVQVIIDEKLVDESEIEISKRA